MNSEEQPIPTDETSGRRSGMLVTSAVVLLMIAAAFVVLVYLWSDEGADSSKVASLAAPERVLPPEAALAALQGEDHDATQAAEQSCSAGFAAPGDSLAQLIGGEIAALQPVQEPVKLLDFTVIDGAGREVDSSTFWGGYVLLNFWATWCPPCREELPSLNNLASKLSDSDFSVITIAVEKAEPKKIVSYFNKFALTALPPYLDRDLRSAPALRAASIGRQIPTSVLVDPAGCVVATLAGPAVWDSFDAETFVREWSTARSGG